MTNIVYAIRKADGTITNGVYNSLGEARLSITLAMKRVNSMNEHNRRCSLHNPNYTFVPEVSELDGADIIELTLVPNGVSHPHIAKNRRKSK